MDPWAGPVTRPGEVGQLVGDVALGPEKGEGEGQLVGALLRVARVQLVEREVRDAQRDGPVQACLPAGSRLARAAEQEIHGELPESGPTHPPNAAGEVVGTVGGPHSGQVLLDERQPFDAQPRDAQAAKVRQIPRGGVGRVQLHGHLVERRRLHDSTEHPNEGGQGLGAAERGAAPAHVKTPDRHAFQKRVGVPVDLAGERSCQGRSIGCRADDGVRVVVGPGGCPERHVNVEASHGGRVIRGSWRAAPLLSSVGFARGP
jgi:hypothetical protein